MPEDREHGRLGLRLALLHALPFALATGVLVEVGLLEAATVCAGAGALWVIAVLVRRQNRLARDLRRSREEERRWHEQAETLAAVLDALPAAVMAADVDGSVLVYNPASEAMLGIARQQVPVSDWAAYYGIFRPDTTTPYTSAELPFVRAMRGEVVDESDIFVRNQRRPGTWISAAGRPVRGADGQLRGGVLLCHDVTQRREAEAEIRRLNVELEDRVRERTASLEDALARVESEAAEKERIASALRESRQLFRDIVDNAPAIIFIKNLDGRYILVAPRWETDLGIPRDQTLGRTDLDLFPPEVAAEVRANDRQVLAAEAPQQFEEDVITAIGMRSFLSLKFPLHDAQGNVYAVCGIATDITERKQMEAELRQLEELARRNQAELTHVLRLGTLGEIASSLAHEINQPLGAIANFAGALARLLDSGQGDPEALRNGLTRISTEALRAGQIIRRLRDLGRKGEGRVEVVDVAEVVRRASELMEPEVRLRGISLRIDAEERLPGVYADVIQIEQVLLNLLLNAIESMHASDGKDLAVRTAKVNGNVEVTIRDSGVGVDPALADRFFEPFFTTKPKGLGMGLAISRRIIEAHGGRLWAAPNQDGGASFVFTLPAADRTGDSPAARGSAPA